jgi:hypothetical protein
MVFKLYLDHLEYEINNNDDDESVTMEICEQHFNFKFMPVVDSV